MRLPEKRQLTWIAIIAGIIVIVAAAALPAIIRSTETPDYCATCHVMQVHYDDWFYTGRHTQIKCVDCHLPNDNFVNHFVWKGLDGIKDIVYFYTGLVPEPIHSTAHARRTVQSNCERCHEEMVSRISTDTMQCWDCHRKLYHNRINEF